MKKLFILLFVMLGLAAVSQAQPYYTNSTPANGAYLPNASVIPATQPAATLAAQYRLGINTGTSVTSGDGTVTNTFATN